MGTRLRDWFGGGEELFDIWITFNSVYGTTKWIATAKENNAEEDREAIVLFKAGSRTADSRVKQVGR